VLREHGGRSKGAGRGDAALAADFLACGKATLRRSLAVRRFLSKFANLFRGQRAEQEMAREIAAHLALLEDDYQRRGMTPEEARLAAGRAYVGIDPSKELDRAQRSVR